MKKIKCTLGTLDKAVRELELYELSLKKKLSELNEQVASYGGFIARARFSQAMYAGTNDTEITVEPYDKGYKIIASGQAVIFVEFGTGTKNPEHPLSSKFGYHHGTYGKGQGNSSKYPNGWTYYGDPGNAGQPVPGKEGLYRTQGNPANRCLYETGKDLRRELARLAKEVFDND